MHIFGSNKKRASAYQGLLTQQCRLQQKDFHLDQMVDQVACNLYKKRRYHKWSKLKKIEMDCNWVNLYVK